MLTYPTRLKLRAGMDIHQIDEFTGLTIAQVESLQTK